MPLRHVLSSFADGAPELYQSQATIDARAAFEKLSARSVAKPTLVSQHSVFDHSKPQKWVRSIQQVGDAVGLSSAGKNYVKHFGLSSHDLWCKDPRKGHVDRDNMPTLPRNVHPAIKLAFKAKRINVHLVDKGTEDAPADEDLYDAEFGAIKPIKEITPDMEPDGGDMPEMQVMCPPPGETHRYELTVSARDPRVSPPDDDRHGVEETVMFEGRLFPPGSNPDQQPSDSADIAAVTPFKPWPGDGAVIASVPLPLGLLGPPQLPFADSAPMQQSTRSRRYRRIQAFL